MKRDYIYYWYHQRGEAAAFKNEWEPILVSPGRNGRFLDFRNRFTLIQLSDAIECDLEISGPIPCPEPE